VVVEGFISPRRYSGSPDVVKKWRLIMRVKANSIRITNWRIGDVLEDTREGETKGVQVEIVDYEGNTVELRLLPDDERVTPDFIASQIR
jgi:hypothetical protein